MRCVLGVIALMMTMAFGGSAEKATPKYSEGNWNKRRAVFLESDRLKLVVLPGGGHIAALMLKEGAGAHINPLWEPPWHSMEPQDFTERDLPNYGGSPEGRLLASITGHNLCLDFFGPPSPQEQAEGLTTHGEAPVQTWDIKPSSSANGRAALECTTKLAQAQLVCRRTIRMTAGQTVLRFDGEVENLSEQSRDIGWQEHVTLGPPFVEKGVTVFDTCATWGQVLPVEFSRRHRLKRGAEFTWHMVEGADGKPVDLRVYPNDAYSGDFTTQLMDPQKEWAWFTAVNPKRRLLVGYLWRRDDFPWLGNWEENYSRLTPPWNGKTLTRGMEFGLSPFPTGREAMIALGTLQETPTLRRLPGKGRWGTRFYAFLSSVPPGCEGVRDVTLDQGHIVISLRQPEAQIALQAE